MIVIHDAEYRKRIPDPAIHLGISHACAGGAAMGLALAVEHIGGDQRQAVAAGIAAAVLVGLLLCAVFLRALFRVDAVTRQLADGKHVAGGAAAPRWPLSNLIDSLNTLSARVGATDERGRQAAAYHQELVRQVSEAAIQEERNRMARDLHDSIKQQIFSMSMSAATAEARWEHDPRGARAVLADIRENAREAQVEMEALLQQLRPAPLETMGLIEALRIQVEAFGYRSGAAVSLDLGELPPDARLPPGTQDTLFRIAQELLANVARHARPGMVAIHLYQRHDELLFEIRDDGLGFDAASVKGGMGLANVRERVFELHGHVVVDSAPGAGTTVRVSVPIFPTASDIPSSAVNEESSTQQALTATASDADSLLRSGAFVANLGAILIFFDVNIGVVLLCIILLTYHWLRVRNDRDRLAAHDPASSQSLAVTYRLHGLLAALSGLLALCAWYLPLANLGRFPHIPNWIALTVSSVLGVVSLVSGLRWLWGSRRYLLALEIPERQMHIAKRLQVLSVSLGLWFTSIALIWANGGLDLNVPLRTADQWAADASLAILIIWPTDILEYVGLLRMQRNSRIGAE
jgi:signal transduction histidine kinase